MEFQKRKAAAIAAMNSPGPDKSPKGTVDVPIIPLLDAINSHPAYFTTSSCSGRISVLSQPVNTPSAVKKKAGGGSWLFVSHDAVQPSALSALLFGAPWEPISEVDSGEEPRVFGSLVFRFEPLIIAVECENVEAAERLVSVAISCGFRESGITSVRKRVIIAIRSSIRLEVPLGTREKLMVSAEYVEYLVELANEKMANNRKRTDLFYKKVTSEFSGHGIAVNERKICNVGETCSQSEKIGDFRDSLQNQPRGMERNRNQESKLEGILDEDCVNLSSLELVGEPIESLSLWGHSACALNEKEIIIFGGFGGIGRHARRNELLLLDSDSRTVKIIASASTPSPRLGHSCSLVGDYVYIIGGRANPTDILNEVWTFNTKSKVWSLLQCSGCFFPPRHRHTAVVVNSKIYVYGGINNDATLSTLHVLDTNTNEWSEIETLGDQPGPRHSHSMVVYRSNFYIFGGHNGEKALNDLYSYDVQKSLWRNIETRGKSPNNRFSHMMLAYSNCLFIFGGCPVGEPQELFLFDLPSLSWRSVRIKSLGGPFVRSTASVIRDELIVIGGGASCYAFGTKFSEPMNINLAHLMQLFESSKCQKKLVIPCVLRIEKNYAKFGKDILKKVGWLDLERHVYSVEGGRYICFPITKELCCLLEDKVELMDKTTDMAAFVSPGSLNWKNLLKNISISAAVELLAACGATKHVDETAKLKKKPSSPSKVMREGVAALLSGHGLSLELLEQLPSRWEKLGDIIVLPVGSFMDAVWDSIKDELWPLVAQSLGTRRLARQGRIAETGTRDSNLEILVGKDGWVDHFENGIHYSFDTTKCMFSWGNLSEKLRMGRLDCRHEVIVDLFAGVGYFVLPFLVRANAKMVYACEWNPDSVKALHHNLQTNKVADRCMVLEGDNRATSPKGVADRVCLGLLPSSECSWGTAVRALKDDGGRLHIHGNVKDSEEGSWISHVLHSISDIAASEGHLWEISVEHVEKVKWYAPHVRHLVLDLRLKSKA